MVTRKRGLGRGLDVLLGEQDKNESAAVGDGALRQMPIEFLSPGRYQPRKDMDTASLQELARSIESRGVMQPIIARPLGDDAFEIIAGERRWRASQLAGLHEVPVIVRDVDDHAAVAMSLIENIQREDLNPMEEARALQRLVDEFTLTHQEVADAVSKNRSTVTNYLRLNQLQEEVAGMLERGQLEMGHARTLLTLPSEDQRETARQVIERQLSVRQTEALVRKRAGQREGAGKRSKAPADKDVDRLASNLSERLGQPVAIRHSAKGKGQLVISYNSLDELDSPARLARVAQGEHQSNY